MDKNTYPRNKENFRKLADLCRSGNIVPYVGAGLSRFANLPLWQGFIEELKESCPDKNFSTEDLKKAADIIEKQLGKEKFYRIFKEKFFYDKDDKWWIDHIEEKGVEKEAISLIPNLFNGPIITTNFDKILEAIHDFEIDIAFPYNNTELLKSVNKERKHLIYKAHGCVSEPEKVIFTGKSYKVAYKHESEFVVSLSDFFKGFSFLFLGCSLNDEPIDLWKTLTNSGQNHYAILACSKENEETKRTELEKQQIHPIFFPEGEFEAIKIILDELLALKKESIFKTPEYKSEFVGRETTLQEIEQKLNSTNLSELTLTATTLFGMGGVGKTRIVCEYEKKHKDKYSSGIYFIRAFSKENVQAEIFRFAIEKKLINEQNDNDHTDIMRMVKNWMNEKDNWLFILDNVEHYEHIMELLVFDEDVISNGKRHFLITTRKKDLPFNNKMFIGIFNENEARKIFCTRVKGQEPDEYASDIAKALGYLPLALEQATAYIVKQKTTYQQYLEELQNDGVLEKLKQGNHEDGTLAVGATYNISLRMLEREASKQLLNLCSFFAPDDICCEWFVDASNELPDLLQKTVSDKSTYYGIIDELTEYSLVNFYDEGKLSIHRLVQEVIRNSIRQEQAKWRNYCINILHKYYDTDFSTTESRTRFNSLFPHIESVVNGINSRRATVEASELYFFLGFGFSEVGNYSKSLKWYKKDLAYNVKMLDKEHPYIATIYNNIADIYRNIGNYSRALKWYHRARVIDEKGKEYSDTAATYSNIAEVYRMKNDYPEALEWLTKALTIHEKKLRKKHPEIATIYNNFGNVYQDQDDYTKALKWYRKALRIDEKASGGTPLEIASTYNNIAEVYRRQGNYQEALIWLDKALKIDEKVLGKKHLETAMTYSNKAMIYYAQDDYPKALELHNKALTIRKQKLDEVHPDIAVTYNNIAEVYRMKGEYPEALELYDKALVIEKKVFGQKHRNTAMTYNNKAQVYYNQGDYPQALKLFYKAMIIKEKKLGKKHSEIAVMYNNIATVYYSQGDYSQAFKWFHKALAIIQEKKLGKKHPATIMTYNNIAMTYANYSKNNKIKIMKQLKIRHITSGLT